MLAMKKLSKKNAVKLVTCGEYSLFSDEIHLFRSHIHMFCKHPIIYYIILYIWLVVSNIVFIFHNIWDNPSHWLSYFSRWLKPPTRYTSIKKIHSDPINGHFRNRFIGGTYHIQGLYKGIYPQNMALYGTVQYLHVLDPGDLPLILCYPTPKYPLVN